MRYRFMWVYWVYLCFTSHATIFQLYLWRHKCAGGLKKKLYLRSGSQRHRHFVGFFNVPVLHRHGTTLLYGYSEKPPHVVAFYDTLVGTLMSKRPYRPKCKYKVLKNAWIIVITDWFVNYDGLYPNSACKLNF